MIDEHYDHHHTTTTTGHGLGPARIPSRCRTQPRGHPCIARGRAQGESGLRSRVTAAAAGAAATATVTASAASAAANRAPNLCTCLQINQVGNPEAVVAVATTIPNTGHGHNFHICEPVGTVVTLWVQRECGSPSPRSAGSPGGANGTDGLAGGAGGGGDGSGDRGRGFGRSGSSGRLSDITESPASSFNTPESMAEARTSTASTTTTAAAADDATTTTAADDTAAATASGAANAAADDGQTPPLAASGGSPGVTSPGAMAALKLALTMPASAVVQYKVWYTVEAVGEVKFTGGDGLNLAKLRRWASWSSGK